MLFSEPLRKFLRVRASKLFIRESSRKSDIIWIIIIVLYTYTS